MVKVAPTPSDPYKDNAPSWFWTTFELKTNQGLAYAQKKFETYGDVLPAGQAGTLLAQAGLGGTAFANYVSDGQQIQFSDAKHKIIRLGNTKLEWFLVTPLSSDPKKAHDPTTWTNWATSCHTCHGQASGQVVGNTMKFLDFTPSPPNGGPVGPLAGPTLPPAGYRSLDFVWALASAR